MRKKKLKNSKVRKNFRFPADLAEWAQSYADRKGTNVTKLIVDYFVLLREQEKPHVSE
jgi:hypothetical protein